MESNNTKEYQDIYFKCIDCGGDAVWTAGEQKFYKEKGLYPPKRCKICAKKRREALNKDKGNVPYK